MRSSLITIALGAWLLWSTTLTLSGEDFSGVTSFTPTQDTGNLSPWLRQLPPDPNRILGEARFEIIPPAGNSDLLATVSFNEVPGGFLKIFWITADGSRTLSDNFYEGIDMANRRSLLISQLAPGVKGTLVFQTSQENLGISRIHWEWLKPQILSASENGLNIAVLTSLGTALEEKSVSGDPAPAPTDRWKGSVITAPLLEKAERIEQGVEFEVELEDAPLAVRLEGQMAGLPLDKHLTVWVNGRPLAPAAPEAPDLSDSGYETDISGKTVYIGWRKVQVLIPETWLQKGMNKLQFSWGDESPDPHPVAAKDLNLQLRFPAFQTVAPLPEPLPEAALPATPISGENFILDPLPVP